ncbi:MAG: zinc finger domain-containing protein [Candidatus Methanoperedens sp.]|nr:zinc finger domain-containing protein [Candidatus Methanoperedens sp.]MCZ7371398.1 zinc finger domain-containing protein [Candidatus Methanoperedens sp.]
MAEIEKCVSCGVNLVERGYARFSCPQCKKELGRCVHCRHQSNPYKCPGCGFEGP